MIIGLSAAIGLSIFLFNLSWSEIVVIGDDVGVVREDVAYMKGLMESYWNIEQQSTAVDPSP